MRVQLLLLLMFLGGIQLGLATAHDITTVEPDATTAAPDPTAAAPDPITAASDATTAAAEPEVYLSIPSSCTTTTGCVTRVQFSECDTTVNKCVCANGFAYRNNICQYKNYLHEECGVSLSWCVPENSECLADPAAAGSYTCQCKEGLSETAQNQCVQTQVQHVQPTTPESIPTTAAPIEVTTQADQYDHRFFDSPATCWSKEDCSRAKMFSICDVHNMVVNGTGVTEKQCRCDEKNHYFRDGDKCYMHAQVGDVCTHETTKCIVPNSICKDAGTNSGEDRCRCEDGLIYMQRDDGLHVCAQKIHKDIDSECATCEANDGVCYDSNKDDKKDGCKCPISLSGPDCEVVHVNVLCNVDDFTMTICYTPHAHLDADSVSMYVYKKGTDEACKGKLVLQDGVCSAGTYQLTLPMKDDRERCATERHTINKLLKFDNTLVVRETGATPGSDMLFKTYCSFQMEADKSFDGVNLNGINQNDRGVHQDPSIFLIVENHLGHVLAETTSIQIGDRIRFRIELTDDGTYTAMRVLHCTASNKPAMPDPKALTMPLTLNGCPYKGNGILDLQNNWRHYASKPTAMETGLFPMFNLKEGDSVFMHCSIKLCLKGSEADCEQPTCEDADSTDTTEGGARRKRAVDSEEVRVTRELRVSPNAQPLSSAQGQAAGVGVVTMGTAAFTVLIALLVIMVLISIAITVFMYSRVRQRKSTSVEVGEMRDQRPPRFAMPRIGRSHQRM